MHMLWEEHTANHLSIDNSVNLTQGWNEFVMGSIKGRKKLQRLRWLIWEMSMRRLGRGFGTGLHTWRRTENNQTKPLIFHNCATSCPCSPQHFRNSSHLYLSLGAKSLIVYSIFHFLEDKTPDRTSLFRMVFKFSEKPSTNIFLIHFEGYNKSPLLIHKSFNHMPFLVHVLSFFFLTLGKIFHTQSL